MIAKEEMFLKVSMALDKQGFVSAVPVQTKTGDQFLDGKEMFVLTRALKGNPLPSNDRYGEDRLSFAGKYGQSIARLHKALKSVENYLSPDEVNLYKTVTEWALPNVKKQNEQWSMGISEHFFDDYITGFGNLYEKLPKQLIHRDPNPSNILFAGEDVTGFIDFDLSELNVRLWDPCYCATGILSESNEYADKFEMWPGILKAILNGYDSENRLTAEEKQAVFYVLCSIQMICVAYFEIVDEYKQLAKSNRKMLQFIINSREYINRIF